MNGTLTLKEFLENRSRTIRVANPQAASFAAVMAKRIMPDTLTGEDFLGLTQEVFPQNEIAKKSALKTWDAFTFARSVQEVTGQ